MLKYITTNPPGFIWIADVKSSFMYFYGRDKYEDGRGHMFIKLFFFSFVMPYLTAWLMLVYISGQM